jgi:UDP-N-acetyl-D-galactosamine dehydrogenase
MKKIAIIGLGYVGLPLAVEFSKYYPTIGFDTNKKRVDEIMNGFDSTLEIEKDNLAGALKEDLGSRENLSNGLFCSYSSNDMIDCNFFIVTVPTPIDKNKNPVFTPLINASQTVGEIMNKGSYVIYESTVYPGATEEICVPVLEKASGLKMNQDFFVGYSPERINPGDKERTLVNIVKITSGSTERAAEVIDDLYQTIISAGTFRAESIKVAEAAKVIENSQRDINIAFVNELSKIFNQLDIDTKSVLEAAGTKWNFLDFKPGLVGGHCIGVDPYYLAQRSQEVGYHPEIILAGRRLNDGMAKHIASEVLKYMIKSFNKVYGSDVLILGVTFKENCPDIRNSKVIDLVDELIAYGLNIDVLDSWVDSREVYENFGINLISRIEKKYNAIILAVSHKEFLSMDIRKHLKTNGILYDIKGVLNRSIVDARL